MEPCSAFTPARRVFRGKVGLKELLYAANRGIREEYRWNASTYALFVVWRGLKRSRWIFT